MTTALQYRQISALWRPHFAPANRLGWDASCGDRLPISGFSCKGPIRRPNTDNADHALKFLMSTLILILSRSGIRTVCGFATSDHVRDPPPRASGVSRRLPIRQRLPQLNLCRHYYFTEIHCGSRWPCAPAADAKSMKGGMPMLSLPFAKIWVNKARAARRMATQIASGFVPRSNLTPMTHEALCYACMVGIVMSPRHDIVPRHPSHGRGRSSSARRKTAADIDPTLPRQRISVMESQVRGMQCKAGSDAGPDDSLVDSDTRTTTA